MKGTKDDGSVEVRVVHDGTNGVEVNEQIKVMDYVPCLAASDVQAVMREAKWSGMPFYALTADVNEAHRQVVVAPEDIGYQACHLAPKGACVPQRGWHLQNIFRRVLVGEARLFLWIPSYADDWLLIVGGKL